MSENKTCTDSQLCTLQHSEHCRDNNQCRADTHIATDGKAAVS